jgi:UDP:flavonoid glycosyltransferase YjiC (YdhE family)
MPPGKERFESFVPRMLAGVAAPPRARELLPFLRDWHPDLLVHEETELGGPVAAAAAGVPWADQAVGIMRPLSMARLAGQTLAPLAEEWGVDIGPYAGLFRYLYLDVCPPSLQSPEIAQIEVAHLMSNVVPDAGGDGLPAWIDQLDQSRPTVYVSLGTIFNQDPGVFATILAGLGNEHLNLIVTLGPGADPAVLGPQPEHVHVEAFIPQDLVLPRCDVVINQGGTAILSILGHGRPVLVLPQGANQFHNAEACVASGAGRCLVASQLDSTSVRTEVLRLLDDPSYAEAAGALAREMADMPRPADGVALLERLVADHAPLLGSR